MTAPLWEDLQFPEVTAFPRLLPLYPLQSLTGHCSPSPSPGLVFFILQDAAQASVPSMNPLLLLPSQGSVPLCPPRSPGPALL